MNSSIKTLLISPKASIRQAMEVINQAQSKGAPTGLALIVDNKNKLLGMVTDGDIRRGILAGCRLEDPTSSIMINNPITVRKGLAEHEILAEVASKVKASGRIRDVKVNFVITLNEQGEVEDVINFFDLWKIADVKNRPIAVIGLGFVGLTLAVGLAESGFEVIGYDSNEKVRKLIAQGIPPFHERGLSQALGFHLNKGHLKVTDSLKPNSADIYLLCVGTPLGQNKDPDLGSLKKASHMLGGLIKKRDLVILRSTVPVGTTREFIKPLLEKESQLKAGEDFYLSFAPERTIEGRALEELRTLPQVIGGLSQASTEITARFFSHLNNTLVRVPSLESAEMVKLANNSFRDLSFAFANELAMIAGRWDLNVHEIIRAANEGYPRNKIPIPSPGVGGICLRKDPYILYHSAHKKDYPSRLSINSREINESMIKHLFKKLDYFVQKKAKDQKNIRLFLIGFAFKGEPETSDMRESTTLDLLHLVKNETSWNVLGYDPILTKQDLEVLPVTGLSLKEGFKNSDMAVFMTNHASFRDLDILGLVEQMKKPALIMDCWNLFSRQELERLEGISYEGLSGKN